MIKTALFYVMFILYIPIVAVLLIPVFIFRLLKNKHRHDRYIALIGHFWSFGFLTLVGAKTSATGLENIPNDGNYCFACNHQSYYDTYVFLRYIWHVPGFITKQMFSYIPIIRTWLRVVDAIFINRNNREEAVLKIKNRLQLVKNGYPMLIFPEGTRSRSQKMGTFKRSGLIAIAEAGVNILPVTFNFTSKLYELQGKLKSAVVSIHFHPIVKTEGLSLEDIQLIPDKIRNIIESKLLPE